MDNIKPNEFVVPRENQPILRFMGFLLAENKQFRIPRILAVQRIYRTTAGKYVYEEEYPLFHKHRVKVIERLEGKTITNKHTIKLLAKAAKIDTDLGKLIYEELY